jgi:ABC-type Fe3+-hydroxamate transport system substrate-binding protein
MKKAIIITVFMLVTLALSACGNFSDSENPIVLTSPELNRKERFVDDISNEEDDFAVVLGMGEKPWIVPKPMTVKQKSC